MKYTTSSSPILYPLSSILVFCLAGCQLIGVLSQAAPPATVVPNYKGFAGQSVGVMVWADRGMRIEWELLQLDLANSVQAKLQQAAAVRKGKKKPEVKELAGTTYPVRPESIIRFQQDHPEVDGTPITEVAPRLGVSRLIYVEVEHFATRPDGAIDLFRGDANVTVRVVEISSDGQAKVVYEENDVTASFPPKAPKEGRPTIGDRRTYIGLIDALSTEIVKRFIPHPEER
jgi:hypothetical protein